MRSVLYSGALGFVLGVALAPFFSTSYTPLIVLISLAALFALLGTFSSMRAVLFIGLFLFTLSLGVIRAHFADTPPPDFLTSAARGEETLILKGTVVREPDTREDHTNLTVRVRKDEENREMEEGRILVIARRTPAYRFGDTISMSGSLERPEKIDEKDGRIFDYPGYLKKDGIFFLMYYPRTTLIAHNEEESVVVRAEAALLSFKNRFLENLFAHIPEPESALLAGLLLGVKRSLGEELLEVFRIAGLIHIVVLSGYNVSLVAEFIRLLFSRLPRFLYLALSAFAITLFALLVGFGATVVRAVLMGFLIVLARATGRTYDALHALILAGVCMVAVNPLILAHDPSFQLSFIATFGLIAFCGPLESRLSCIPAWGGARALLAATVAAQVSTLPLIVYLMGTASVVAVFANLLVLPLVAPTMALGALTGLFAFFSGLLASPFAFLSYLALRYMIVIAEGAAELPFASIAFPAFPLWFLFILYVPIIFLAWHALHTQKYAPHYL